MNCTTANLSILICVAACSLRPSEERFVADQQVGRFEDDTLSVYVEDGLAVISRTDTGLHLWMSAPAITLNLRSRRTQVITLEVDNAMGDTVLLPGSVVGVTRGAVTRKTFSIALVTDTSSRYQLQSPGSETTGTWSFAAIGDVQERIDDMPDFWPWLRREMDLRFVVIPGDLTGGGTAAELERFKEVVSQLDVPFYATLGNHEVETGDYSRCFGRGSYHFAYAGVAFTFLDLASATLDPAVEPLLDGWLTQAIQRPHVVVGHVPPIDPVATRNAAFSSRPEAYRFLSRLAEGRIDLAIYGHIHSYYEFTHAGIPARITGGGGARPETLGGVGRHYLLVDVHPNAAPVLATTLREIE